IALALESVDERIGGERGAAYKTFLAYYHVLNTLGLDAMIAPINEFFAPVKKPKAKETPSEDGPAPKVANADIEEPKDNPTKVETPVKVPA
ncbi:MAG: hypothetical protein IT381_11300, partial [Deltaproteobacteria bacterium]|nr:hypothetical protein [Deltaproteobacteria bacterium]